MASVVLGDFSNMQGKARSHSEEKAAAEDLEQIWDRSSTLGYCERR